MPRDIKLMNKQQAETIVSAGAGGDKFYEAVDFLMKFHPDSEILRNYLESHEQKIKGVMDAALKEMQGDKPEYEALGHSAKDLKSDKKVLENLQSIASIYDEEAFSRYVNLSSYRDSVHIGVESNGIILGEERTGADDAQLQQERELRKKIINEAMEAAKQEVMMFYARDQKFSEFDEKEKRKILEEGVYDVFNFKMAKIVAASAIKNPTLEQANPNSKASTDYQNKALEDMRAALEAFYAKKPVVVKPRAIMESAAHTSESMDSYEKDMRKQKLVKSADLFNQKKEDYNDKRRSFWGNAFDHAKKMWKGMKENKYRILTDAAVVAGAGLAATFAPIAAAAGMAAYFATSSYAWLVNDERKKQKKAAEDKAKWKGFKGMANAWKSIMGNEESKKTFLREGTITAVAGVAGAGLFGAAASTAGLALGRVASGVARAVGSLTNQATRWAIAEDKYKKNATDENKEAKEDAKVGFFVSAGAAVLVNTVSAFFGLSHDTTPNVLENGGVDATTPGEPIADGVGTDGVNGAEGAGGADGVEVAPAPVEVPTEWNENMGISEAHWNEIHDKITGIYKDHADIFGKENVAPEDAMANMYQNIENAREAGYFAGQTNEQVIYSYMKLIEHTERAVYDHASGHLITRLDEAGNPMYWNNAEEMAALNKIIICNEKVEIEAGRLGDTLALINDKGGYTGEGAGVGVTNNHYVGGRYDCDEYQNAWAKGAFAHKHPHVVHQPITPAEPEIEETTIDQPKVEEVVEQPKEKLINWHEGKYTTGDNTIESGPGSHGEKIVEKGVAPEPAARIAMANMLQKTNG